MSVTTIAAGSGRGGSTLVSQLLGQREGHYNVGELRQLWVHHDQGNQCSCGAEIAGCPFWVEVCATAADAVGMETSRWMSELTKVSRAKWKVSAGGEPLVTESLAALVDCLLDTTESTTIVDASKMPSFLGQLAIATPTDFVHLIRDSRAVAYSWKNPKNKSYARGEPMRTRSVGVSAALWAQRHIAQERVAQQVGRYVVRLKYEDFCLEPERELRRVLSELGIGATNVDLASTENGRTLHALAGNPGRFGKQVTDIVLDEAWRTSLGKVETLAVSALTWPLLMRYGYLGSSS